jgi:hypothetical protein
MDLYHFLIVKKKTIPNLPATSEIVHQTDFAGELGVGSLSER